MKTLRTSALFQAVIYVVAYYAVFFLARSEENYVYGYIAGWCVGLWISSLLDIHIKTVVFATILFVAVTVIDIKTNFYCSVPSKQSIDIWIIWNSITNSIPIALNHGARLLISK